MTTRGEGFDAGKRSLEKSFRTRMGSGLVSMSMSIRTCHAYAASIMMVYKESVPTTSAHYYESVKPRDYLSTALPD